MRPDAGPGAGSGAGSDADGRPAGGPVDVEAVLHAHGLRVTSQRRRVVAALAAGTHLTPEQVAQSVAADGGDPLPPSTVYRALDALEQVGVVTHTHLTHGAPTYHLAGAPAHLHLVCRVCGDVRSAPAALADGLTRALLDAAGFAADLGHMGIHGVCDRCRAHGDVPADAPDDDAPADAPGRHDHPHGGVPVGGAAGNAGAPGHADH